MTIQTYRLQVKASMLDLVLSSLGKYEVAIQSFQE